MDDGLQTPGSCIFCGITSGSHEASLVHEDDTVVAFMDRYPVTPGHLLVVPRAHSVGLEDTDEAVASHVMKVAQGMASALRFSAFRPEGINLLLCDGEVAFQTVFHLHLHVIPRYPNDGWAIGIKTLERDRSQLNTDAEIISEVLTSSDTTVSHDERLIGL